MGDTDIHFTIPDPTFLEMFLLNIRGNTIKYSSKLKKQSNEKEDKLIKEIEYLEGMSNNDIANLITSKKDELEKLREVGDHGGRVVTLSPPTSEAGVRFPAQPQVGKLVIACHWSAVYSTEP